MHRYEAFLVKYTRIITNVCSLLRTGHTATFVVGNIRKTKGDGRMLPLHMHTTQAFDKVRRLVSNYRASVLGWGTRHRGTVSRVGIARDSFLLTLYILAYPRTCSPTYSFD